MPDKHAGYKNVMKGVRWLAGNCRLFYLIQTKFPMKLLAYAFSQKVCKWIPEDVHG